MFSHHDDWVEGVIVTKEGDDLLDERFFTHSADGKVAHWELDAEQNCDVYRLVVRKLATLLMSLHRNLCAVLQPFRKPPTARNLNSHHL